MADFEIDYTQFSNFMRRLTAKEGWAEMERASLEELANQVLIELLNRTPVKTGRLRAAWRIENPKIIVVPVSGGYECVLTNSTYYAYWVENGHKQHVGQFVPPLRKRLKRPFVYGRFFVRSTCDTFNNGKATPIVERHILKWLEGLFN